MENTSVEEKKLVADKTVRTPELSPTKVLTVTEPVMVEGAKGMVEVGSLLPATMKEADERSLARMKDDGAPTTGPRVPEETPAMSESSSVESTSPPAPMRPPIKPVTESSSMAEVASSA